MDLKRIIDSLNRITPLAITFIALVIAMLALVVVLRSQ